jgi:fimbrial chaperone protein
MTDTLRARGVAIAFAALAFAGGGSDARAEGFQLSPVRLSLTAKEHVASIAVLNPADVPLRIEVRSARLTQNAEGRAALVPSDDLLVFPQLVTIPAHAVRNVRVAATLPAGEREGAYEVVVTEINAFAAPAARRTAIALQMQADIPVFVAPQAERRSAAIADASVRNRTLAFSVRSDGSVHVVTKDVRVTGEGTGGKPVFAAGLEGGLLLAGGAREYRVALTRAQCGALRAATIRLRANDQDLVRALEIGPDACK